MEFVKLFVVLLCVAMILHETESKHRKRIGKYSKGQKASKWTNSNKSSKTSSKDSKSTKESSKSKESKQSSKAGLKASCYLRNVSIDN